MNSELKSPLLRALTQRGFVHQCTDNAELDAFLCVPRTLYIGFDATAESLHVGSLLPLMVLRWARFFGHKVIVLLGGGTTLVGDPSGKEESRKMLDSANIALYAEKIYESFGKILHVDGPDIIVENNLNWLGSLGYIDFLRDVGAHFSVNKMLSYESVKRRLDREQNLSFLEFNYMLCQAFDFFVLSQKHGCFIQGGGSDQWGNIVNGVELIRRKTGQQAYGLTFPLLLNKDGSKMGKTADGAVWLHKDKISPYAYWQFWRNTADEDCRRFLLLFTCLDVSAIETALAQGYNEAKTLLADEATGLLHGYDALSTIHDTVQRVVKGEAPFTVSGVDDEGFSVIKTDLPVHTITQDALAQDPLLITHLAASGAVGSKGQARRLMRDGGCCVDGVVVHDEMTIIDARTLKNHGVVHVRLGKKKHLLLRVLLRSS